MSKQPNSKESCLAERECVPCKGGVPPLQGGEAQSLLAQLDDAWQIEDGHHLHRLFGFKDFVSALDFANKVGAIAEQNGHHPDLYVAWGKVGVKIWTHKIDGLSEADFVLAAKIDRA
jgi:4a-hydroxytetrahydrobiopterin dehydratase